MLDFDYLFEYLSNTNINHIIQFIFLSSNIKSIFDKILI